MLAHASNKKLCGGLFEALYVATQTGCQVGNTVAHRSTIGCTSAWRSSLTKDALSIPENHLIELLPRQEQRRLHAVTEPFCLRLEEVLCEIGQAAPFVYFPTRGFVSLIAMIDGSPGVELGMVGREGMVGAHLALGVAIAPTHVVVQGPGSAWRIASAAFSEVLESSPYLQRCLHRYNYVLMTQHINAAACMRFHQIGPRLARWLLMSEDRAQANHFQMTHEFLAFMLGVRRVGITAAAGVLQKDGLIAYHRGHIRVQDRAGLEAASCSCYASDARAYKDLLDRPAAKHKA